VVAKMRVVIFSKVRPSVYESRRLLEKVAPCGLDVEICQPDRFAVTMGRPVLTYDGESFVAS
jgi:hypothetical protein